MKKLDDYRLQFNGRDYLPIIIGGMGVDISATGLALVAARLGGIGHISAPLTTASPWSRPSTSPGRPAGDLSSPTAEASSTGT